AMAVLAAAAALLALEAAAVLAVLAAAAGGALRGFRLVGEAMVDMEVEAAMAIVIMQVGAVLEVVVLFTMEAVAAPGWEAVSLSVAVL
ncbi:MAG: hypothetical protein ACK5CA_13440, partial [Cyanobacteriota bacterium]